MPWASYPNSFAKDISQNFHSGALIKCLYSWANSEIWWVTEFASRGFWYFAVNAYRGRGCLLPLDLKLELGPPVSNLGGCAVFTLGDVIVTSEGVMCGPKGDLWKLCWKFVVFFPSSSSLTLVCGGGIYLVRPGCSVWVIPEAVCSACYCGESAVLFPSSLPFLNIS